LSDPFVNAIARLVPEVPPHLVERPPDPALGDYALPCFALAKARRKAPPAIAAELAAELAPRLGEAQHQGAPLFTAVEAAGPYLNFRADAGQMARLTLPSILDGSYFQQNRAPAGGSRKVMVEYSQPNTHKAFHVGHMRNVALGDALARILAYNGQQVTAANYIGDVGTHIAKCLWFYQRHLGRLPKEKQTPQPGQDRGEWLGELYTAATLMLEDAPKEQREVYQKEVGQVLQQLESGQGEAHALWQETRAWSLESFQDIYRWLGARFDHWFYESEMEAGRRIVEEGLAKGVFIRSEGAVGADLEADGLGFLLVLKADGTTLYSTKDLALAEMKFDRFGMDESVYVVGAEQTLHFKQVFKVLEKLGYPQAGRSVHLAYGLVMLPEGKMSSRAGNVILFSALRERMNRFIVEHYLEAHRGDWRDEEIDETCRRIAVAAIRYGMVKQDPSKVIVFNLEDWLVAEGDTGVYLCYAYTRVQSIFRALGKFGRADADLTLLTHPTERALIRELHDFNRAAEAAARLMRPNLLAGTLFALAKAFSRAYAAVSVKNAETPALGEARLALFDAAGRVLKEGLELLGITPPERM